MTIHPTSVSKALPHNLYKPLCDIHHRTMNNAKSRENLLDATRGIIRVQPAPFGHSFDPFITYRSDWWQREACVQIRRYLGRECDYGMGMEADGWNENLEIWPFTEISNCQPELEEGVQVLIGATAFEKVAFADREIGEAWRLEFCWIHPFYRSKQLLTKAWPHYIERYGAFLISHPISPSFQKHLQKVNHPMTKEDFLKLRK